jgi:hypothetical protein
MKNINSRGFVSYCEKGERLIVGNEKGQFIIFDIEDQQLSASDR